MESNSKCKNGFEVIVGGKEKEHGRKKNVNSYKVGSRLIYNKTGYNFWGNWFVEEIKGKKLLNQHKTAAQHALWIQQYSLKFINFK